MQLDEFLRKYNIYQTSDLSHTAVSLHAQMASSRMIANCDRAACRTPEAVMELYRKELEHMFTSMAELAFKSLDDLETLEV